MSMRPPDRRPLAVLRWAGFVAVAAWAVMTRRALRALRGPIVRLRQVVRLQLDGDATARADENDGGPEVRDLAVALNELVSAQADALRLQQVALDVETAFRNASGVDETVRVLCRTLGPALGARRLLVDTLYHGGKLTRSAQWHADDLDDLPAVTDALSAQLGEVLDQLWNMSRRLLIDDLTTAEVGEQSWIARFRLETGARSVMMVPVGLGSRVIGTIKVLTDDEPRRWTSMEAAVVQQIAAFLARAITLAEAEVQHAEYIAGLEELDRQKTDFLSTISHELRTPLTSIAGYVELLLDGAAGEVGADQRAMLAVIERNTLRLAGLIEDLLVINRIEYGALELAASEVSLGALLRHTVEELRPVIDKLDLDFQVEISTEAAVVVGDSGYLQRVLANVVSNALKFTPSGTVRVVYAVDAAAGEVTVTCRDTGIGIPQADLKHLFTRFFRASNAISHAIPGSGLGLPIVKTIVEMHHGQLAVDSVEGVGTTVTMRFPASVAGSAAGAGGDVAATPAGDR